MTPPRHPVRLDVDPRPPRTRLRLVLPAAAAGATMWWTTLAVGVLGATSAPSDAPERASVPVVVASAQPAPAAASPAPARVGGLTVLVSGDHAEQIRIRSFQPARDALGMFAVKMRLEHVLGDPVEFMPIKVTAVRGDEIIATADGMVESLDAGQTITTEPFSADDFPRSVKGITYEVEFGS